MKICSNAIIVTTLVKVKFSLLCVRHRMYAMRNCNNGEPWIVNDERWMIWNDERASRYCERIEAKTEIHLLTCSRHSRKMIVRQGNNDNSARQQRLAVNKTKLDKIAFNLAFCLATYHYARVERVGINGNDDNCLDKCTEHNKILVMISGWLFSREKSISFTMKFYAWSISIVLTWCTIKHQIVPCVGRDLKIISTHEKYIQGVVSGRMIVYAKINLKKMIFFRLTLRFQKNWIWNLVYVYSTNSSSNAFNRRIWNVV